ncbi:hypothetical protein J6TS2_36130 [Heyndrickxia sporothermodurans]|nr:hypothetical protein J6TS2_36130 [Heyndrickxia sporothermodurans]
MRAHLENYERPSVEYYYSCKLQDDGNIFNRGTIPDSNQNGVEWTIEKYFKLPILSERDAKNP